MTMRRGKRSEPTGSSAVVTADTMSLSGREHYWDNLDVARREVAAYHGLIQRIFCALRLHCNEDNFASRVAAIEAWCAERERDYRGGV